MSWDELLGQAPAQKFLRTVLRNGRLAHAYLFTGPSGVGKRTAARVLARVLLCHQPPAPDEACGTCKSCRWLSAPPGQPVEHPDLLVPIKTLTGGEKLVGDQEPIIPLDAAKRLAEQLHRTPHSGPRRVAIVPEAQRLCRGQAEAANSFLKSLEEPPAGAVVILTTSHPEALLETIVSRCQPVTFRRLAKSEVLAGLSALSPSAASAELAAALADGSLGRAKEILSGDLGRWRMGLAKALGDFTPQTGVRFGLALWALAEAEGTRYFEAEKESGRGSETAVVEDEDDAENAREAEEAQKTAAGWKRFVFTRLLELCELNFRDALVRASGAGEEALLQRDQAPLAEKLAALFGAEGCENILLALREALFATRLYVRGDLVGRFIAGRMIEAAARGAGIPAGRA
ncbi:MAG: hypothetical protein HS116_07100 [Planctomycetes bacterium]|nr:hypothetical protein [Planctomycetota bacterium]